jgi:predicted metal-dependent phosphoesterase TrpH
MGLADLHIHTIYSYDGTCSVPAVLKHVKTKTNLNVIAITDHDAIRGALEALELAPKYQLEVIPGCEVSSRDGHVLALFIQKPIPPHLPLKETVLRVGEQGGICIAAHPTAPGTSSLDFKTIWNALQDPDVRRILVGVESFNGGLVYTRQNPVVERQSRSLPLAQVGNSDAHILRMIGQGATIFSGNTAQELRYALEAKTTGVYKGNGLNGLNVMRDYLPHFFLRKFGWVTHNHHPQDPLRLERLSRVMSNQ